MRVCLDAWGLSEVLSRGNSKSAAESPKCLYQSGSEAEDSVQRIESLIKTCARVLREELGSEDVSNSIASSRPDRQVVPSQSEKRDDGHSTRSRVKGRECDGPLAQVGETMSFKVACCEVAELESRWVTRACLDRTGEKGEDVLGATAGVQFFQPLRRPAKDDQWQRGGFTMLMSGPWDTGGPTGESMAGNRGMHATESLIQDEARGGPVHLEASLQVTKCQRRFELPMNPNVIGGNPAVRRVVKGSRSAGDEASEEQFATHLDSAQHIRQLERKEVRKTT